MEESLQGLERIYRPGLWIWINIHAWSGARIIWSIFVVLTELRVKISFVWESSLKEFMEGENLLEWVKVNIFSKDRKKVFALSISLSKKFSVPAFLSPKYFSPLHLRKKQSLFHHLYSEKSANTFFYIERNICLMFYCNRQSLPQISSERQKYSRQQIQSEKT